MLLMDILCIPLSSFRKIRSLSLWPKKSLVLYLLLASIISPADLDLHIWGQRLERRIETGGRILRLCLDGIHVIPSMKVLILDLRRIAPRLWKLVTLFVTLQVYLSVAHHWFKATFMWTTNALGLSLVLNHSAEDVGAGQTTKREA